MKNLFLNVLSKSSIQIIIFLITTTFAILFNISNIPLEVKIFLDLFYFAYLGWFISGKVKDIIFYILSFILLIVVLSINSVTLELKNPGIITVFFPSVLFTYFSTTTLLQFSKTKFKFKSYLPLLISLLNIFIVSVLYYLFTLNNYISLVIACCLVILFGISLLFTKINKTVES